MVVYVVIKCTGKEKMEVFQMICMRSICDIRKVDRVRNTLVRKKCGCILSVLEYFLELVKMIRACGKNG